MPVARGHAGWDEYWAAARSASCVPENPEIARTLAAFWIARFAELPTGTRVLDVATGNGIVLACAHEAARRRSRTFALTGTDLAAIDPVRWLGNAQPALREARFLGGVPAEKLPFEAACFDCVVSQYGLEYADLAPALAEVARVLAPGGRLLWLAHHAASDVVLQNAAQVEDLGWLLGAQGPYPAMRAFVAAVARPERRARASAQLRDALARAEQWCREHPPARAVAELCREFVAIAERAQAYRADDLQKMLDDGERALRLHRLRLEDLSAAVLTPVRLDAVRSALGAAAWRELQVDELRAGEAASPVGLWIQATRAGV